MDDLHATSLDARVAMSRRRLLQALGIAAAAPVASIFAPAVSAQGRCIRAWGTPACSAEPIPEVFERTGWHTIGLDHILWDVAEPEKEAAFYEAFMGWRTRSITPEQVVIDMGDWGSSIFNKAPESRFPEPQPQPGRAGGGPPPQKVRAIVTGFCWDIAPWDARAVEAALRARQLNPAAKNGPNGFESFLVKDPDGFPLQISNGKGLTAARRNGPGGARLSVPAPFEPTGWKTVWLDHLSFSATDYKKNVSFYQQLLHWDPTYDEGSQNELMIGDIGNTIIRGGNRFDPKFGGPGGREGGRIDHISFGIAPWDTARVRAETEKRNLPISVDTSDGAPIETAQFKSYHTRTAMNYNLQYSYNTHDTRLNLAISVNPRRPGINPPPKP
ncbi:MAG: glyoxalase [Acidobacteria bacterium]|nr:glyoxalase [Acidobacteriota bacterium]